MIIIIIIIKKWDIKAKQKYEKQKDQLNMYVLVVHVATGVSVQTVRSTNDPLYLYPAYHVCDQVLYKPA